MLWEHSQASVLCSFVYLFCLPNDTESSLTVGVVSSGSSVSLLDPKDTQPVLNYYLVPD